MRPLRPLALLVALVAAAGPAAADPSPAEVAWDAWRAAEAGTSEAVPLLVARLEAASRRPPEDGDAAWALGQTHLDALAVLGATAPDAALLPLLETHPDAVVLLLARAESVAGLRTACSRLGRDGGDLAWWTAGAALAALDADAFRRRLLDEARIERTVVVTGTGGARRALRKEHRPRDPSSARPPPVPASRREVHVVPPGFPPVGVWRLRREEAPGRTRVHPRVPAYAERTVRAAPPEGPFEVVLERGDDLSPSQARLDWLQAPVLGRPGVVRLDAEAEFDHAWVSRPRWRRFAGPLRASAGSGLVGHGRRPRRDRSPLRAGGARTPGSDLVARAGRPGLLATADPAASRAPRRESCAAPGRAFAGAL